VASGGIRAVAEAADVSVGTVSHYLNGTSPVSAAKSARIQAAIDSLGFVRNNAGRQLRLGRSSTIGYIAPDVSNPFFTTLAEGVERRARDAGLSVFLANSMGDSSREDSYLALFEEYRVRGMIVASAGEIEPRLAAVRSRGTPSVLMGQPASSPDQPSVSVDDALGGRLAAEHLIGRGRGRIAFVGGPLTRSQVRNRLEGASAAVRESPGVTLEVVDVPERTISAGHAVATALLERPAARRPDAVFAVNDLLAIGIVQTLVAGGLRVPQEVAIVGYDDIEYAENAIVPLSSVRPPQESLGSAALDLLLAVAERPAAPVDTHLVFAPRLVERRSSTGD
jgi:LacI family transcriptional regulator